MKIIIVPIDFSAISLNAAYYACDMALAVSADILLVHIVSLPVTILEIPLPTNTFDAMANDANEELKKLKDELVLHFDNNKINISVKVTIGNLLEEIDVIATQTDTFAIVMGTQGAGAAEWLKFGSNTLAAISSLSYSIITVPLHAKFKKIAKIGLACDLEEVTETIPVNSIGSLLTLFNCELDVLYVSKPDEQLKPEILPESIFLQNDFSKFHPKFHFLVNENIETGISDFVLQKNIDLLLVIHKKHGFWDSVFHKSISKEITFHSQIPMMIMGR
jgi:nucleotide-binding universal stress UspA family protein